jgi:hypothetical protein
MSVDTREELDRGDQYPKKGQNSLPMGEQRAKK